MEPFSHAPAPTPEPLPRPASRRGLVALIASGSAVLFLGLAVATGLFAASLGEQAGRALGEAASASADAAVERYQSGETMFTFPAALEFYADGRFQDECPVEFETGCWEAALFTEADCDIMTVMIGYSDSRTDPEPQDVESMRLSDVVAYEQTHVVYGNDEYDYGWIADVVCHDRAA